MRRAMRAWIVIVLAGACGAACAANGGERSAPASAAGLIDVKAFCDARANAECNALVVKQCGATDQAACATKRAASCMQSIPQGTVYVAELGQKCVDLVTACYADAVVTNDEKKTMDVECGTRLFSGPGAARSPCTGPYDCSSAQGLTCLMAVGADAGKCLAPTPIAAGAPCVDESAVCPDAFFCDGHSKTCQARAIDGESCSPTAKPCAPGLVCPGAFFTQCKPKAPKGHACLGDAECADGICDKAASATEGNCTDKITFTTLDVACTSFR